MKSIGKLEKAACQALIDAIKVGDVSGRDLNNAGMAIERLVMFLDAAEAYAKQAENYIDLLEANCVGFRDSSMNEIRIARAKFEEARIRSDA